MSISAGDKVGPYEIIAPLGAGGMGEVWKARDPRLGRTVALKFSKSEFSERFEREAHAVAALKHPNVCTIYDVGPNYLVMELVEGKPLKGPLPLAKAVAYAGQILDALDAAHKQGIIHRDLKPDNILLTSEGIKLLDFGLAKHYGPHEPSDATLTNALTGKAQIVGTLQYMSPEQLQGKQVDTRSDLFSFGCVLYELISGKRAFTGDSMASVIAAVLEREPAPLEIAEPVDRVIKRCLAKDPDERFQTARDLKTALAWAMDRQAPVPQASHRPELAWAAAACLGFIAIAALWAGWRRPAHETTLPMLQVDLDVGGEATEPAMSADGLRIAFVIDGALAVRRLDQPNVTRLNGTAGATYPFFSPDGQWVAFFADGKLKKISVEGNVLVTLCDAPNGRGGSWGEDGDIIAALVASGLLSVSGGGGTPRQLATNGITSEVFGPRFPQVLPRGKGILFTGTPVGSRQPAVHVLPRNGGNPKLLLLNASSARYTAAGFLVYQQNGTVFAAPMDIDRLELTGAGRPWLSSVQGHPIVGASNYDISSGGILVYKRGPGQNRTLAWLDSSGRIEPIKAKPADYLFPRLSTDGKRLAVNVTNEGHPRIWIFDFARETMSRLTTDTERQQYPVWTHDGEYVAYRQEWPVWARSDGSGITGSLPAGQGTASPFSFSSDGNWLVLMLNVREGGYDLGIARVERTANTMRIGEVKTLLRQPGDQGGPSMSPDGRWVAYLSDETGRREIFVIPFVPDGPAGSGKFQVSSDGGIAPRWSPLGHELFFRNLNQQVMVVGYVTKGSSFVPGKPRLWSTRRLARLGGSNFDVAPDGRRLLVILDDQEEKPDTHLRVLINTGDELRQKAAK